MGCGVGDPPNAKKERKKRENVAGSREGCHPRPPPRSDSCKNEKMLQAAERGATLGLSPVRFLDSYSVNQSFPR
jgi:hypothetical protein